MGIKLSKNQQENYLEKDDDDNEEEKENSFNNNNKLSKSAPPKNNQNHQYFTHLELNSRHLSNLSDYKSSVKIKKMNLEEQEDCQYYNRHPHLISYNNYYYYHSDYDYQQQFNDDIKQH